MGKLSDRGTIAAASARDVHGGTLRSKDGGNAAAGASARPSHKGNPSG
jgi:hypothetical protein